MERMLARDALTTEPVIVSPEASLSEVIAAASSTRQTTIPVADGDGVLLGVITYDDLRQAMLDRGELAGLLLAADLAEPTEVVLPTDSLGVALRKMNARALDAIPVVASAEHPSLCGVLTRADVLAAYERELMHEV
jgi:CBS domain-containing protein